MDHPWESLESFGSGTGSLVANQIFIEIAHRINHIKPNDCIESELMVVGPMDKISVSMLSSKPWKPVWRKVSFRGCAGAPSNMIIGNDETFYHVLLNCEGQLTKLWLSEDVLGRFTWCS